jgi:hypothetical protein
MRYRFFLCFWGYLALRCRVNRAGRSGHRRRPEEELSSDKRRFRAPMSALSVPGLAVIQLVSGKTSRWS